MEIGKSLPEKYARRLNGSSFRAGFPCPLPRSLATTELARTIVEATQGSTAKLKKTHPSIHLTSRYFVRSRLARNLLRSTSGLLSVLSWSSSSCKGCLKVGCPSRSGRRGFRGATPFSSCDRCQGTVKIYRLKYLLPDFRRAKSGRAEERRR